MSFLGLWRNSAINGSESDSHDLTTRAVFFKEVVKHCAASTKLWSNITPKECQRIVNSIRTLFIVFEEKTRKWQVKLCSDLCRYWAVGSRFPADNPATNV